MATRFSDRVTGKNRNRKKLELLNRNRPENSLLNRKKLPGFSGSDSPVKPRLTVPGAHP